MKITVANAKNGACTICGEFSELRPYGKDGAFVCFPCGMKDEETAMEQFEKQHGDADVILVGPPKTEN